MSQQTLESFMRDVLLSYPGIPACLDALIDNSKVEYAVFHPLALKEHIGQIEFRLRKETYWLQRVSNIRNTAGYDQYRYQLVRRDLGEPDDPNIAFRFFREKWLPWHTVNMNTGALG